MNEVQEAAWYSANSGATAFEPGVLATLIVGVAGVVVLTWFCWVCLGAYRATGKPGAGIGNMGSIIGRALFVLVIVLAIISF